MIAPIKISAAAALSTLSTIVVTTLVCTPAAWAAGATVGTQAIAEEDMIVVQVHCADLLKAENESPMSEAQTAGSETGDLAPPDADGRAGSTVGADDAPTVDLVTISLEDCRAAGLVDR